MSKYIKFNILHSNSNWCKEYVFYMEHATSMDHNMYVSKCYRILALLHVNTNGCGWKYIFVEINCV